MTRADVLARLESIERELDTLEMAIIEKAGGEAGELRAAMARHGKGAERNFGRTVARAGGKPVLALLS